MYILNKNMKAFKTFHGIIMGRVYFESKTTVIRQVVCWAIARSNLACLHLFLDVDKKWLFEIELKDKYLFK